jgi:DNA-directed RNA polymerase specialized sigma24 family protein
VNEAMHDHAARRAGGLVTVNRELEREFEARLSESSTLAFRVAYAVLRHRQDAEDVAQEAFVKAYRVPDLRDRIGFGRGWCG